MLYLYLWNKFLTAVTAMFSFCTIHSELPCITLYNLDSGQRKCQLFFTLVFDIITLHWVELTTQDSAGIKYALISRRAGI
jgi:hypothetical protein